jgi:GNAT superfamily N-acetyltransferase
MTAPAKAEDHRPASGEIRIRPIDPHSADEIALVALRMRETLIEVEGEETGVALYTMEWLKERVRWHLDAQKCTGAVFISENSNGYITGHTLVRIEVDEAGKRFGLFSTTYVEPVFRKQSVASLLTAHGESWMTGQGLSLAATWTSASNTKLIGLYEKHGYAIDARHTHEVTNTPMIRMAKVLHSRS